LPPPSGASEQASERDADSPFGGVETPQEEYRNPQAGEKFSKDAANQAAKPELILPSGSVSFTQCAQAAFPVLAKRQRFFSRDRTLVEIAYNKLLKDAQRHDVFQLLEADAFRSRLEADFHLWVWREQNGKNILKPGRCTNDAARVLLKSDEALEYLPAITFISARPVYTLVGGELKILYRGYHDIHGGIFVSHGDPAQPIPIPKLSEAVSLLLDVLKDYDFVTPSDKARALAFFISPALRTGKFLGDADFPIDVAEANESQGGKTYRLKLVCALYGEIPYVIANRKGGVGSLDESISSALVAGVPFILFDNYRGRMDSQILETSLRGIGKVGVRVPHRGEIQVSTTHVNWQLSSNGIEGTRDFVNRSIINRICKRPKGYQFASYREGDILAHIKANQSQYLGAVFAIIKEWITQGCPRTNENRHDFTEWASSVDWIVQNIFALPPLLEGHTEEVLRVSDPALSWLRALAIAVNKDNRLDVDLSTSDIVEICQGTAIDFPNNKIAFSNIDQISMYTGRLLTRLFHDLSATDCLRVDRYKVEHSTVIQPRQDRSGEFSKHFYRFTRRS